MRPKLQKLPPEPQAREGVPVQAPPLTAEEIWQMIAEAAYYRAEKRGFTPGLEAEDWRDAEAEVLARVRALQTRM